MSIGFSDLNKRIDIYQGSRIADDYGGFKIVWQKQFSMWAKVIFLEQEEDKKSRYEFIARNNDYVKAGMRIRYNGDYFVVKSVKSSFGQRDDFIHILTVKDYKNDSDS